ncbi:MAG: hypothetical protein LBU60_05005 [Clostridiales bacterium]|jgi:hypothetical protein|nr:hypothetical protein [Clostridiales bacterium]
MLEKKLFSQREHMRDNDKYKINITYKEYAIILEICKNYFTNIAWIFPSYMPGEPGVIIGVDDDKLNAWLLLIVPKLHIKGGGWITVPEIGDAYDGAAIFDLVEYVAEHIKDYSLGKFNDLLGYFELLFDEESNDIFYEFKMKINKLFDNIELPYTLNNNRQIQKKHSRIYVLNK